MDAQVQLVFRGEVLAGHRLEDVKRELGRVLKLDEARLAALFSGARAVLKRSLNTHEAQRYVEHLSRLGARVHVEPMAPPPSSAPAMAPFPSIAAMPAAAPAVRPAAPAVAPAIPARSTSPQAPAQPPVLALVPVAEEEEQIVCPNCGERQSKRLLCRSCSTNMPMGIAAKLEAEELERQARQEAFRARRGLKTVSVYEVEEAPLPRFWSFSFDGRIGRLAYATNHLLLMTLLFALTAFFVQRPSFGRFMLLGAGGLFVALQSMRMAVLRCHDCDRHGWWSLFTLVPYAGGIASLLLSLLPGNRDDNDFGEPPRPGRWPMFFLALTLGIAALSWTVRAALTAFDHYKHEQMQSEDVMQGDNLAELLHSEEAAQAFRNDYELAPNHKAFASSTSGAWGSKAGSRSLEDAMRGALDDCEARRQAYTATCQLVNVDGQVAPVSTMRPRR